MALDTKLNLTNAKFEQVSGDTLNLSGTTVIFKDFKYGVDRSPYFVPLSIATAGWVTGITSSIINNTSFIVNNGLTKSGVNIRLGGALTGNTDIKTTGNTTFLKLLGSGLVSFGSLSPSARVDIQGTTSDNTAHSLIVRKSDTTQSLTIRNDGNILIGSSTYTNDTRVDIRGITNTGNTILRLANNSNQEIFKIRDNRSVIYGGTSANTFTFSGSTGFKGVQYLADYSANFTNRSLVDKEYVTGITYITANNGVTRSGNTISLGGSVTADKTVTVTSSGSMVRFKVKTNQFSSGNAELEVSENTAGTTAFVAMNNGSSFIQFLWSPTIDNRRVTFVDGMNTKRGIEYGSSGYVTQPRSLTDKAYVDALTYLTANNGIIKTGSNLTLGGSLTGNTTVTLGSNNLTFSGTSGIVNVGRYLDVGADSTNYGTVRSGPLKTASLAPLSTNGYGAVGSNYFLSGSTKRTRNDFASAIEFPAGGFSFRTAPIGAPNTTISWTTVMTINTTGGTLMGSGNITPSTKLDVRGVGSSSSTFASKFFNNSSSNAILSIRDDGQVLYGEGNNSLALYPSSNGSTVALSGRGLVLSSAPGGAGGFQFTIRSSSDTFTNTSGESGGLQILPSVVVASGSMNVTTLSIKPTYNQTATATGILYGLDYNPTVTSIASGATHVAIRTTTGQILFGTSTPAASSTVTIDRGASSIYNTMLSLRSSGSNIWNVNGSGELVHTGTITLLSGNNIFHRLGGAFSASSGSGSHKVLQINPGYNYTSTASGTVYGIDYTPTLTNVSSGMTHYAIRTSSGQILLGNSTSDVVTSGTRLDVRNTTNAPDLMLRLADSSNVAKFTVNGQGLTRILVDANSAINSLTVLNSNAGSSARSIIQLENDATQSGFIRLNSSTNTGLGGINSVNINTNSGSAPLTLGVSNNVLYTMTNSNSHAISQNSKNFTNTFISFTQAAHTGPNAPGLIYNGGAHLLSGASLETIDINFNLSRTVTKPTSTISTQRAFLIQAPTYAFSGSSTINSAGTLVVTNAPIAGTNATITNSHAIWVQAGDSYSAGKWRSEYLQGFTLNAGSGLTQVYQISFSSSAMSGIRYNSLNYNNPHVFSTSVALATTNTSYSGITADFSFTPVAGTGSYKTLALRPTLNTTATYGGTVYGLDYDPKLTNLSTGTTHVAARFTSGQYLIGGTVPTNKTVRLEVWGTSNTNDNIIRLNNLAGSARLTVAGNGITALNNAGGGGVDLVSFTLNNGTFIQTSGNNGFFEVNNSTISTASGAANFRVINLVPTYNQTGTATGTIYGIDYKPTVTSIASGATHIAARFVSGNVLIGASGITSNTRLDVRGINGGNILRLANTGNTVRFIVLDNGTAILGSSANGSSHLTIRSTGLSLTNVLSLIGDNSSNWVLGTDGKVFHAGATQNFNQTADYQRYDYTDITNITANSPAISILSIKPDINATAGSGKVIGLDYNPTITSTVGLTHLAFRATKGNVLIGATGITTNTKFDLRGVGTTTGTTLRIANSGNTEILTIKDSGLFNYKTTTGNESFVVGANDASTSIGQFYVWSKDVYLYGKNFATTNSGILAMNGIAVELTYSLSGATTVRYTQASGGGSFIGKHTFTPTATRAGLNIGSHTADPSTLTNFDIWGNSSDNSVNARLNGSSVMLLNTNDTFYSTNRILYVSNGGNGGKLDSHEHLEYNQTTRILSVSGVSITGIANYSVDRSSQFNIRSVPDVAWVTGKSTLVTTNRRTANYTLVIGDQNKLVESNSTGATTITIPPNSGVTFAVGTQVHFAQYGSGACTIVAGAGVTLRSFNNNTKLSGQYSGASVVKIATNEWYLFGDLTS